MRIEGPRPQESRWPPAAAVLGCLVVLAVLPTRMRVLPPGGAAIVAGLLIVPMLGVQFAPLKRRWLRIERIVTIVFSIVAEVAIVDMLIGLLKDIAAGSTAAGGLWLLSSSIFVWLLNVASFALLYWQIDRGGPSRRANGTAQRPDWLFAQAGAGDAVASGWEPAFVDYFFLGFTTATAFSPTDALPLTPRAKLFMMVESMISMVTILVTVSRAINTLA